MTKTASYTAPGLSTVQTLRHWAAMDTHPIGIAVTAWLNYAKAYRDRYESEIGDDGVLGPGWQEWGMGLRTLLNGETGGLDDGTVDAIIVDNLTAQGLAR